jgi:hypothetical protein
MGCCWHTHVHYCVLSTFRALLPFILSTFTYLTTCQTFLFLLLTPPHNTYNTILYYTILYYTILYYTILHYTHKQLHTTPPPTPRSPSLHPQYKQGMNEVAAPFLSLLPPPGAQALPFVLFEAFVLRFLQHFYCGEASSSR